MKRALLIISLAFFCFFSAAVADIETEKSKLQKIQQEISQKKKQLLETKKKEQKSLSQLVLIKKELNRAKHQLGQAQHKIYSNEEELRRLRVEIKETDLMLNQKTAKLTSRLKEIFKNSSVNYLDLIFSARNMSDFINRSYYFSKLVENDVALINQISDKFKDRTNKKDKLQTVTSEIKQLANTIENKKQKITVEKKKEQELYASLKQRRREYENRIAKLEASSRELTRIIQAQTSTVRKGAAVGSGSLDWPLRGRISSRYGYRRHPYWGGRHMHTGLDIAVPYGRPIKAADGGEVIMARWWDGYGKAVVINHGRGISTVYGHMSRLYVKKGSNVSKGQIIGLVGSTGYSTGPHLHFEVRKKGKPTNPMRYLP